jgi:cytochrome oxidase assembly protein ShyY1
MYFRPSFKLTLILFTLCAVFLRLGLWQFDRKAEKAALFERFENAPSLTLETAVEQGRELALVEGYGRYDPLRHVLLDNKILNGRTGVHVLTPFQLHDGGAVLINRGWLPLPPDRRSLPDVPTDPAARTIRGRLVSPIDGGPRLGEADSLVTDHWPQLVTYLDLADVGTALGLSLLPWVVQLDADDATGFGDRQWKAAVMAPPVHGAYAVQWLALSAATLIIWITLGYRRGERRFQQRPGGSADVDDMGDQGK